MAKDAGHRSVLFDVEDGEEGEEVSIETGGDTEVEPVRIAADLVSQPNVRSRSTGWLTSLSVHGADGVCSAADAACNTVHAPGLWSQ